MVEIYFSSMAQSPMSVVFHCFLILLSEIASSGADADETDFAVLKSFALAMAKLLEEPNGSSPKKYDGAAAGNFQAMSDVVVFINETSPYLDAEYAPFFQSACEIMGQNFAKAGALLSTIDTGALADVVKGYRDHRVKLTTLVNSMKTLSEFYNLRSLESMKKQCELQDPAFLMNWIREHAVGATSAMDIYKVVDYDMKTLTTWFDVILHDMQLASMMRHACLMVGGVVDVANGTYTDYLANETAKLNAEVANVLEDTKQRLMDDFHSKAKVEIAALTEQVTGGVDELAESVYQFLSKKYFWLNWVVKTYSQYDPAAQPTRMFGDDVHFLFNPSDHAIFVKDGHYRVLFASWCRNGRQENIDLAEQVVKEIAQDTSSSVNSKVCYNTLYNVLPALERATVVHVLRETGGPKAEMKSDHSCVATYGKACGAHEIVVVYDA